jgi:glycosyltransferase involved in cell wall biosynthesis
MSPASVLARKALTVAKFWTGDYSQAWQPCARWAAEAAADEVPIDACIGEHSPDAGLFLASWFSARYGVPWIADFRDPVLQPLPPVARRIYAPVVRRLVATAASTINVNPIWADYDRELFGRPAWAISNGFDPDDFAAPLEAPTERFTVAYLGNIIPAQRIEIFLEGLAIARATLGPEAPSVLRFLYRGFSSANVARIVGELGISDVVDVRPAVPREQALAALGEAQAGLLLSIAAPERADVWYRCGLHPAKVFEYFGAAKPILCVPGDGGLLDALIEETRTGVILRTPQEVGDYLLGALADWKAGRGIAYRPAVDAVKRYTRRRLTERLAGILDGLVDRSSVESAEARGEVDAAHGGA